MNSTSESKSNLKLKSFIDIEEIIKEVVEQADKHDLKKALDCLQIGECIKCKKIDESYDAGDLNGFRDGYNYATEEAEEKQDKLKREIEKLKKEIKENEKNQTDTGTKRPIKQSQQDTKKIDYPF